LLGLELDVGTTAAVATLLLAVASALFGAKYKQVKGKASQARDLLDGVIEAAEDDEVSEKDFQKVVASAKRLMSAEG
jgi:hypothetical protein